MFCVGPHESAVKQLLISEVRHHGVVFCRHLLKKLCRSGDLTFSTQLLEPTEQFREVVRPDGA